MSEILPGGGLPPPKEQMEWIGEQTSVEGETSAKVKEARSLPLQTIKDKLSSYTPKELVEISHDIFTDFHELTMERLKSQPQALNKTADVDDTGDLTSLDTTSGGSQEKLHGEKGMGNPFFKVAAIAVLSYYLQKIAQSFMEQQAVDAEFYTAAIPAFLEMAENVRESDITAADKRYQASFVAGVTSAVSAGVSLATVGVQLGTYHHSYKNVANQKKLNQENLNNAKENQTKTAAQLDSIKNSEPKPHMPQYRHATNRGLNGARNSQYQKDLAKWKSQVRKAEMKDQKAKSSLDKANRDFKESERFLNMKAFQQAYQTSVIWTEGGAKMVNSVMDSAKEFITGGLNKEADILAAQAKFTSGNEEIVLKHMDKSGQERKEHKDNADQLFDFLIQMQNELAKLGINFRTSA